MIFFKKDLGSRKKHKNSSAILSIKEVFFKILEVIIMSNKSIGCKVKDCVHHAQSENYCTMEQILVNYDGGKSHTHTKECTDCDTFEARR